MIALIAAALAAAAPAASPAQNPQQPPVAQAEHKMDCKCCDKSKGGETKDCCHSQAGDHAGHGTGARH